MENADVRGSGMMEMRFYITCPEEVCMRDWVATRKRPTRRKGMQAWDRKRLVLVSSARPEAKTLSGRTDLLFRDLVGSLPSHHIESIQSPTNRWTSERPTTRSSKEFRLSSLRPSGSSHRESDLIFEIFWIFLQAIW